MAKQEAVITKLDIVRIGLVSVSDRASKGIYVDKGIPSLEQWIKSAIENPIVFDKKLIEDNQTSIENTLKELTDSKKCNIVFTTGGTGPSPRDVTPEATKAISEKEMPGFGEQIRQISLNFVPTAILSRQLGVIRKSTLIINLPGQPKAIKQTLEGLRNKENKIVVHGIFSAIPYCVDLIGGPYIFTDEKICSSFRPKNAVKAKPAIF